MKSKVMDELATKLIRHVGGYTAGDFMHPRDISMLDLIESQIRAAIVEFVEMVEIEKCARYADYWREGEIPEDEEIKHRVLLKQALAAFGVEKT